MQEPRFGQMMRSLAGKEWAGENFSWEDWWDIEAGESKGILEADGKVSGLSN